MSTYTAEQVEQAIESANEDEGWYDAEYWTPAGTYPNWRGEPVEQEDKRLKIDIDGTTEYVEYVDGKLPAEGGGEEVWVVVKVGDQLFRKDGYYASHYGTDWDGNFYTVTAQVREVTFYE